MSRPYWPMLSMPLDSAPDEKRGARDEQVFLSDPVELIVHKQVEWVGGHLETGGPGHLAQL